MFINPLPTNEELKEYYNFEYAVSEPEYPKLKVPKKVKIILKLLEKFGIEKTLKF